MSAYREAPAEPLPCPRCTKPLPTAEIAPCGKGCGTWVSALAATLALTPADRTRNPVSWWRVRAPCPRCATKMQVYGAGQALLQGCEAHGYFVDADTAPSTGLAHPVDPAKLEARISGADGGRDQLQAREDQRARDQVKEAHDDEVAAHQRHLLHGPFWELAPTGEEAPYRAAARGRFVDAVAADLRYLELPAQRDKVAEVIAGLYDHISALERRVRALEK